MKPMVHRLEAKYKDKIIFTYLDVDDPNTETLKAALGFRLRPHFVLLNAKGGVMDQWIGTLPESDFVAAFEKILK